MNLAKFKSHKAYKNFKSQKNHVLQFGNIGFQILQDVRLTETQFQTFHWILKKSLKNSKYRSSTKLWNRVNLNLNLTKQNLESRMGKGKGNIYSSAQFLKTGAVFVEFSNLDNQTKHKLFTKFSNIFPTKLMLIERYS